MEKKNVYRNEWKYLLSLPEAELLKQRLSPLLEIDRNAAGGSYMIRSLYFDDLHDSSYKEKLAGIFFRKKWRVRIYNLSDRKISLERKLKQGSYIFKESADLTRDEFEKIIAGDYGFLLRRSENLCREFYYECTVNVMRPKVIVDYDRVPFVLQAGTVRITFDSDVRAAAGSWDIFDSSLPSFLCLEPGKLVLEVKYTGFLPQHIKKILPADGQEFTALSKYVICYDRVHHLTDVTAGITKSEPFWRGSHEFSGFF